MPLTLLYQVVVVLLIFKIHQIHAAGKTYSTIEGHQYFINDEQKYTWFDGLRECLTRNMTLATIESDIKSRDINNLIKNIFGKNIILWVGGFMSHYPDSHHYTWLSTGQSFDYVYWHVNNPDFNKNQEYCIQIGWGANMEWNDNICANKYGFICQQQDDQLMEKKLQEYKQELQSEIKNRTSLQQELNMQKRVERHLQEQLEQIKYYEIKKQELLKDFQAKLEKIENLQQELQKQQLEWGSLNFTQSLQKQLEWKHQTDKELQREENYKKCRNIILQFNQNTHVLKKEN